MGAWYCTDTSHYRDYVGQGRVTDTYMAQITHYRDYVGQGRVLRRPYRVSYIYIQSTYIPKSLWNLINSISHYTVTNHMAINY